MCMVTKIFIEYFQLPITTLNKLTQGLYQWEGDAIMQPDATDMSRVNIFNISVNPFITHIYLYIYDII